MIFPNPFLRSPCAILMVLSPANVPVSTMSRGLIVDTNASRKSSTSTSADIESYIVQR